VDSRNATKGIKSEKIVRLARKLHLDPMSLGWPCIGVRIFWSILFRPLSALATGIGLEQNYRRRPGFVVFSRNCRSTRKGIPCKSVEFPPRVAAAAHWTLRRFHGLPLRTCGKHAGNELRRFVAADENKIKREKCNRGICSIKLVWYKKQVDFSQNVSSASRRRFRLAGSDD